jgi:hypothetical protein
MNEQIPSQSESTETIFTKEEILSVIDRLVQGGEYEVITNQEDEKGLLVLEVTMKETDEDGDVVKYHYKRLSEEAKSKGIDDLISVAFFNGGIAIGGWTVAKLIDDEWKLTP